MKSKKVGSLPAHRYVTNDPLHQLFDEVNAISVQGYDENRRVIYWNEGSELLYGYSGEEAKGKKIEDLIIPHSMREHVISAHSNWIKQGIEIPASEITLCNKDGNDVSVFSSHVMFTNQFKNKQMYCIDVDLAEVKQAEEQVIFKQHMLESIFEAIPDLFFLMEDNGVIIDFYASGEKNLNKPSIDFIGKNMSEFLPKSAVEKFQIKLAKVKQQSSMLSFEYQVSQQEGSSFFEARMSHLVEFNHIVMIIRDITEQHKSAALIRQQAYFDNLTALPNRFLALDRLSQILIDAERNNEKTAVLLLDIDDFKKINDSLGHEIGDKLLIKAAARLQSIIQKEETVGRLGGDEFIILLRHVGDHSNALMIVENLLDAFRQPFCVDDRELVLTISIGVAIFPENGNTASDLLRNADTAMYQAKAQGRNIYSFFTDEMDTVMQRRFKIEEQMLGALDRNEFRVFFQAQFDVKTKEIIGAEALIRWLNGELGNVTPDEFIPIAEHTGLIVPIGEFVIKQALLFLSEWQKSDTKKYIISVNLSPRQFRDTELVNVIKNALIDIDLSPEKLDLEITEGVLMGGQSFIHKALEEINNLGIKLAMDDFGTGYSSLSYLRQYPFDVLKIDKSFIRGITSNKADCDLVKATIAMSHSLGLTVVAEGVETIEQLKLLERLKCDFVQGFYLSKPIPANELLEFSASYNK